MVANLVAVFHLILHKFFPTRNYHNIEAGVKPIAHERIIGELLDLGHANY